MKKNVRYKVISMILLIIMVVAIICGLAAARGILVDLSLSNTFRGFCICIATISAVLAWLSYKKSKKLGSQ
ncbi:MAG: hypothetical protein ACLU6B_00945 [Lachnospirales bacterium]